jgi:uncharacterized protein (DUF1778 family)
VTQNQKVSDAEKNNQKYEIMELSDRDRKVFVSALLNPQAPGKRLKNAARHYKELGFIKSH